MFSVACHSTLSWEDGIEKIYERFCHGSPELRLDHDLYLLLYKHNHGKRKGKIFIVRDEGLRGKNVGFLCSFPFSPTCFSRAGSLRLSVI